MSVAAEDGAQAMLSAATHSSRPSLLFLCHTLPYPPDGGVWIRTYHVLRLLARQFDIKALCFERAVAPSSGYNTDETTAVAALSRLAQVEVFPIPQRHSRLRFLWDHARSVLRQRVFTEYLYESRSFRLRLVELVNNRTFDVIHVDSLDLCGYLPLLEGRRVVCVHHNVESLLLRRRAQMQDSWSTRWYIALQARLMKAAERHWCGRVTANVTVSSQDAAELRRLAPDGRYYVVPNGVDEAYFANEGTGQDGVVFVGGTNWFPNRDAAQYFAADILPLLRRDWPKLRARWVGGCTPQDRERFEAAAGMELTGYVRDIRPFVQSARCYVVPLRVGGGSRLKILDAWAMGKAVVSTPVGCEGLKIENGSNILVADTARDFARAVDRVLRDDELCRRLGENGRATVQAEYSWEKIGYHMAAIYRGICAESTAPPTP